MISSNRCLKNKFLNVALKFLLSCLFAWRGEIFSLQSTFLRPLEEDLSKIFENNIFFSTGSQSGPILFEKHTSLINCKIIN